MSRSKPVFSVPVEFRRYPGARLGQSGEQFKSDSALAQATRRLSDARLKGQVRAEAEARNEEEDELRDTTPRAIDEAEAQARYDDNDEGGTRGGRE